MKLIQILVVVVAAALVTNIAAQTGGQNTDTAAPSTAKPQSQHPAATSSDPKKKDSAKNSAASKNMAGASGQTGGIKVIVPTQSAGQTTPSNKNAVVKPMAQTGSSSPASTAKKTTGTGTSKSGQSAGALPAGTAHSGKTAASSLATSHTPPAQKKPPPPVLAVNPSGKVSGKNNAAKKGAATGSSVAGKITQPRIVQKTPSKANIVAAAKTSAKISSAGRRDPFVSPIRNVSVGTGPPVLNCSTGKRGLAIAELTVQGTAKDTDGKMMAIVAGGNHRSYFLRENDQICNGGVQKITADSVVFRESVTDTLGRQTTHEVVKKIGPS